MDQTKLTDRDYMQLLLSEHKNAASCLTKFAVECANEQLRQQCENALHETLKHQKMIWNAMNQRQWYQPRMASPAEISQAYNQFSSQAGNQMAQNFEQRNQNQYYPPNYV